MRAPRTSTVLVGRGPELRALEEATSDASRRPVVLLGGEAGVGKSRLIAELVDRATAADRIAVVGSCVELGVDHLPFGPFVDGLGRLVDALGDRAGVVLGATVPELATLLPDLDAGSAPARQTVGRLYDAVREALDRAPRGLLFVLEDIHWADQSSLDLLVYLASRLRRGRTSIVATFRTEELHPRHRLAPVLAALTRGGRASRIDLDPLDDDAVRSLVRSIRGDATPALVRSVLTRADGNPFLVEELLAAEVVPGAAMPASLRDLLLADVTRLDEPTRQALRLLAVVGRPASPELLEAAWTGPPASLDPALREALDRSVIVVRPGARLAFRHALIGDAVGADLLPSERAGLHESLAALLAAHPALGSATPAGVLAEVAHHLFEAGDLAAAARAAVRAADAAVEARAHPEAAALYERAIGIVELMPGFEAAEGRDRAALLDAAAEARFHAGDATAAVALGRAALDAAGDRVAPARKGYLIARFLEWSAVTGGLAELAELGERAVALLPEDPPTPERALALLSLASARSHIGRAHEGLELARASAGTALACGTAAGEASARAMIAVTLLTLGHDEEAVAEIDRAVRIADATGGAVPTAMTHINRAAVYSVAGRFTELPRVLAAARAALAREGADRMSDAWLATDEVDLLVWQDRWTDAEAFATRMLDQEIAPSPQAWQRVVRGQLRVRTGRLAEGERDLRASWEAGPAVEPDIRCRAAGHLAEAALARGDPVAALRRVDDGLAVLGVIDEVAGRAHLLALGMCAAGDLVAHARMLRDGGTEASGLATASRFREDLAGLEAGAAPGGPGARVAARLAWACAEDGRLGRCRESQPWEAAAAAMETVGERYLAARCRFREAEALLAQPAGRAPATPLLVGLCAWTATVGATPLADDVATLARRARLTIGEPAPALATERVAPALPPGAADLSARELEVLGLLVEGRSNREIGSLLFISEKTASSHVTHILDKLGVPSRGAAAALAARTELLPLALG